jgi:membrane protein implicated in regulation of membrane protease activity
MRGLFEGCFIAGLLLGVFAMLNGVEKPPRQTGRRRFSLNLPTVAGFATVFGLGGWLLVRFTALSPAADVGLAALIGAASAVGGIILIAGWMIPAARAEVVDARYELQGCVARVIAVHDDGRRGVIEYSDATGLHTADAHGLDDAVLEAGTDVAIERIEDGVAYVEAWALVEARL